MPVVGKKADLEKIGAYPGSKSKPVPRSNVLINIDTGLYVPEGVSSFFEELWKDLKEPYKKKKPELEKPPERKVKDDKGGAMPYIDPRIRDMALIYAEDAIDRDIYGAGYKMYGRPFDELNDLLGVKNKIMGYEGTDPELGEYILFANDVDRMYRLITKGHELTSKIKKRETGKSHDELHPEIWEDGKDMTREYIMNGIRKAQAAMN